MLMRKSLFFLLILPLVFSCSQENESGGDVPFSKGLNVNAGFINLVNTGSTKDASSLTICSNEKNVTVKWITASSFNIDTTQTTVSMKNGQGTLPIKWERKQENGLYAPVNVMFKAGVLLTAGEYERYIPLYYIQNLDSAKVSENIRTRVADNGIPKAAGIEFLPLYPSMSDVGATLDVRLTGLSQVSVDYSNIKSVHNIDINTTDTPMTLVTGINHLKFNWKDPNIRPAAFELPIVFTSFELQDGYATVTLSWNPGTLPPTGSFTYVSSNLPENNIPQAGGNYTFIFEGDYVGGLQVRALSEGTVLVTGVEVTNKQPQVTVPANTAAGERSVNFEIMSENGVWTALPTETNRIQEGTNGSGSTGNVTASKIIPAGDIPEKGDTYRCQFKGGPGNVIFRAMRTRVNEAVGQEVVRSEEKAVPATIGIIVPELDGLNATIRFEYSTDGGQNWITLNDDRNQENDWVYVSAPDANTRIAATNGSVTFDLKGDAELLITIYAKYNGVTIGQASGYVPSELKVPVEDNPNSTGRQVAFTWSIDGKDWSTAIYTQEGK